MYVSFVHVLSWFSTQREKALFLCDRCDDLQRRSRAGSGRSAGCNSPGRQVVQYHTHVARMCVKATHKTIQWFFDESVLHNFACLIVSSVAAPYTLHTLHQSFV